MVGTNQQGQAATGGTAIPGTTLGSLKGFSASMPSTQSASDQSSSTTVSGVSSATINITDNTAQTALTGKNANTTLATLNQDVQTNLTTDAQGNTTYTAVDSQGNNTAHQLDVLYTDEVKANIQAGFEITQAFTQQVGTFLNNRAAEADAAQRALDNELKKPENERNPTVLENAAQTLLDNQTWAMGGTGRIALTAITAAFSGNVTGSANQLIQDATIHYIQSLGAQQIKDLAESIGGEGSPAHTALHAVLGCAGAAATGGDCGTAALAASSGVVINKLLDGIEGATAAELTAEEKEARRNLIATLVTGVTAATGGNATVANTAVTIETENNALPAALVIATAVVAGALQAADISLTAWDTYQLTQALATGDDDKAQELIASLAIGLATEAVPGNKIIQRFGDALKPLGKMGEEIVQAAEQIVARNQAIADTLLKRTDINDVKQVTTGTKGSWEKAINSKQGLEPNTGYVLDNGHSYVTDAAGRVKEVGGELTLTTAARNTYQQCATGKCGDVGDEGGHLIASSLGGAGDKINLVPQAASLNRGPWANMEAELREALAAGKEVKVKIDVGYPAGGGVRPSEFVVSTVIDGKAMPRRIFNQ